MKPGALLLAGLVAVVLLGACGSESRDVDWSGSWREVSTAEAYVLELTPRQQDGRYTVEYPRSFKVPFSARTEDGKLLIMGENHDDIVWTLSYDQESDQLTAVGGLGTFHFERVQE